MCTVNTHTTNLNNCDIQSSFVLYINNNLLIYICQLKSFTFLIIYLIFTNLFCIMYQKVNIAECDVSRTHKRKGAMHMLLEQVCLLFIYILLFELAIVTVVAVALFVALVVTIRKSDNKKHISAGR